MEPSTRENIPPVPGFLTFRQCLAVWTLLSSFPSPQPFWRENFYHNTPSIDGE